jgi:DNA-binding transcriptional LysR family regulator
MHYLSKAKQFALIAEMGSISGAARKLNMSTATATAHLDALETYLGGKLFVRSTRELVLTDLGRLYLEKITPLLEEFDIANQLASEFGSQLQGDFRITVGGSVGRSKIVPLVARFVAEHPSLDVALDIDNSVKHLIREQFHVAIRTSFGQDCSLIQRKIASNRKVLVASPAYLASAPPLTCPDDLSTHTLLLFSRDHDRVGSMQFFIDGETRKIDFEGKLTSNSHEALTSWVLDHRGIAQMSYWEAADAIADNRLVRLLEDFEPAPTDFYAVSPFRSGDCIKVDTFVSFLKDAFVEAPLC